MCVLFKEKGVANDVRVIYGEGFVGFDGVSDKSDEQILACMQQFISERLQASEFHPDAWPPVVIRDPEEVQAKLTSVAGDKYSHREMDDFTDLIEKTLKSIPQVSKVARSGVLDERVYLLYSQERLASYGIQPGSLENAMKGRNISTPGGQVNVEGKNVTLDPSGEFKSEKRNRRCFGPHQRLLRLSARLGRHHAGIRESGPLSQFLQLARRSGKLAPQPRHHSLSPDAVG